MFDLNFFNSHVDSEESFFIAGCDEVGRGPLAGPVVAACASLEIKKFDQKEVKSLLRKWQRLGITDSKQLTSEERAQLLKKLSMTAFAANQTYIISHSENIQIKVLIKEIHPPIIDEINILQASLRAMKEAMMESCNLEQRGTVLIDGSKKFIFENSRINLETIVKGDSKSLIIGLASIAAKEYRDQLMKDLAEKYPGYGWEHNAGYPTKKHLAAINELGVTELHRLTFNGVREIYAERGYARI